jgi:hypothetical protein
LQGVARRTCVQAPPLCFLWALGSLLPSLSSSSRCKIPSRLPEDHRTVGMEADPH